MIPPPPLRELLREVLQPGLASGMSHVIEGVRQLMGRGEGRQVKDASIGYVNGNGGIMAEQCSLVLGV